MMVVTKGEKFQEYVYKAYRGGCRKYPNCEGCEYLYYDDFFEELYCAKGLFEENIRLSDKVSILEEENKKLLKQISQMEVYK